MTLNITILSPDAIYQSTDFRLTDVGTGLRRDFVSQKGIVVSRPGWHPWQAVVAFAGVGHTGGLDVAEWLAHQLEIIPDDAPISALVAALEDANSWLTKVPIRYRRHTFTVGAFIAHEPHCLIISNWESLDAPPLKTVAPKLKVSRCRPKKVRLLLTGSGESFVSDRERSALIGLLRKGPSDAQVCDALASLNKRVAAKDSNVSAACFTSYIRITGHVAGMIHNSGEEKEHLLASLQPVTMPGLTGKLDQALERGVFSQGRPTRWRLRQFAMVTFEQNEKYHRLQLKAKPNDADAYNNYGAYLMDVGKDIDGAEKSFVQALRLSPKHAAASGNYANLLWQHRRNHDLAQSYFEMSIRLDPRNGNVRRNFATFLAEVRGDWARAKALCQEGLNMNPNNLDLLLAFADLSYDRQEFGEAVELYERYIAAQPMGCEELTKAQTACATALMVSGGSPSRAAELLRLAVSTNPVDTAALVNLAQLLLTKVREGRSSDFEADRLIERGLDSNPSPAALIEAWYYRYAHLRQYRTEALSKLKHLIPTGARSPGWDFSTNVERARGDGHEDLEMVARLADVISDRANVDSLMQFDSWKQAT